MEKGNKHLKLLGNKIRQARLKGNLTQRELAYRVGQEYQNISRLERGLQNASVLLLPDIANVLNVKVRDLIEF